MGYTEKNLNVEHLNRPAVVLLKKPLATNEEMSVELEKLIGDQYPMVTRKLKDYSGEGKLKALFYHPAANYQYLTVGYDQNVVFHTTYCPERKEKLNKKFGDFDVTSNTQITLDLSSIEEPSSIKFFQFHEGLMEKVKSLGRFLWSNTFRSCKWDGVSKKPISKIMLDYYYNSDEYKNKLFEAKQNALRVWYVFSFDASYVVPTLKYNVDETLSSYITEYRYQAQNTSVEAQKGVATVANIEGLAETTLNTHVIYSTEQITIDAFKKDIKEVGMPKEIADILNKWGVVAIYKVILQPLVDNMVAERLSYKDAQDKVKEYSNAFNGKDYIKYLSMIRSEKSKLANKYGFRSQRVGGGVAEDYEWAQKPLIETFSDSVTKYKDTDNYKIPVLTLFPDLKEDIILSIHKGKLAGEFPLSAMKGSYSTVSNFSYYVEGDIGYLVFSSVDNYRKAVDAYFFVAEIVNRSYNSLDTDTEATVLGHYANCEFPLRYIKQTENSSGLASVKSTGFTNKDADNYENSIDSQKKLSVTAMYVDNTQQMMALIGSYGCGRVGSSKAVEYYRSTRQGGGPNCRLIDFKILYYMMIKYNVVLPKYNKLEPEFIHGNNKKSTVRMFPVDFFTATGSIESGNTSDSNILTFGINPEHPTEIQYNIDTISRLDMSAKKRLVEMYEQVYYGGWSGFYYTNATGYLEDVARYTNTALVDNVLTTVQESIKEPTFATLTELRDLNNTDVTEINISRQTMGKSSATISLKSVNDKYSFKKGIYQGECLFEPMDEVNIYLPTYTNGLTLSFSGIVSSVDNMVTNGYHSVSLQCDCPIKLLEINRTNIKPSMSGGEETDYSQLNPFLVPTSMMKSIENWAPLMLAQSLTYMTSMLGDIKDPESTMVYDDDILYQNGKFIIYYPHFNDPLLQYLWSRKSQHQRDLDKATESLVSLVNLYTSTIKYKHGQTLDKAEDFSGIENITSIYSYNSRSNKRDYTKVDYAIYAQRSDSWLSNLGVRKQVAQLTGTLQPAFALGADSIPLVFSNYKTNLEILLETAEKFNFFFYSNRYGIVRFSPPNTSLTGLNMRNGVLDSGVRDSYTDYSYYVDSANILSKQNTINFRESCNDENLINWMQLSGGFVESVSLDAARAGVATTVVDKALVKKYGYHTQKQQSILGITNLPALQAYGMCLMDRNNKNFRTAECEVMGSGDIDINQTVYSSINNTIYLRVGMVSHYSAGQTFTTSSSLNWGRKPLFESDIYEVTTTNTEYVDPYPFTQQQDVSILPKIVQSTRVNIDVTQLSIKLEELYKKDLINSAYYRQVKSILDAYKTNKEYEQLLYSFVFNGFFWDGVPTISFEDLSTEFYSENVANGLEIPVLGSGKEDIVSGAKNLALKIKGKKTSVKGNNTAQFIGLFDQSTPAQVQGVYLKK